MKKLTRKLEPHLFMVPSYLVLLVFMGYPLLNCIRLALSNYKVTRLDNVTFAGLDNFKRIFADSQIGMIAANTIKFVLITLLCQLVLGFILALALKKPFKGRGIYQGIVFLPWAFSGFVVGLIFRWSFNGEYGVVNDLLLKLGLIEEKIAWLGTPGLSLAVIIIAMIWIGIPFFAIMILAALQSIPADVYEAAEVDGCGVMRQFFQITLPYIKPTLVTTTLLRTIWIFNSFDLIVVVSGGGPANTSQTLTSYMYSAAFGSYDLGFAAAIGVMLMIVLGVYALLFLKITRYDKAGDF